MSNIICRHCGNIVQPGADHHCRQMQEAGLPVMSVPSTALQEDDSCFITSAVAGYASGNSLVGTVVGGDTFGAITGAALSKDENTADRSEADSRAAAAEPDDEPAEDDDDDDDD